MHDQVAAGSRRDHRRRADAARFQSLVLRLSRRHRTRRRAAAALRSASARSARQASRSPANCARRAASASSRSSSVETTRSRRPANSNTQGDRARSVHAERTARAECQLSGSLRAHRGAAAPSSARSWRRWSRPGARRSPSMSRR